MCKDKNHFYLIGAIELTYKRTAERIQNFVERNTINILNFTGPRAPVGPLAYDYALQAIACYLKNIS